jgi:hypothetical protein
MYPEQEGRAITPDLAGPVGILDEANKVISVVNVSLLLAAEQVMNADSRHSCADSRHSCADSRHMNADSRRSNADSRLPSSTSILTTPCSSQMGMWSWRLGHRAGSATGSSSSNAVLLCNLRVFRAKMREIGTFTIVGLDVPGAPQVRSGRGGTGG